MKGSAYMARRKTVPMKSHTIRMTDEEWAEMQKCAEIADENDSEYIRKAVTMRNQNYNGSEEQHRDFIHNKAKEILGINPAKQKEIQSPMVNTFMKGEKK
jgi:hypothetical protein